MISNICWLPDLVIANNLADWQPYQEMLYGIFREDFVDSRPVYKGKPVQIRKYPLDDGKEKAFWHLTTVDYHDGKDRQPDIRRCERMKWVRAFIEHSDCNRSECLDCEGMLVWISHKHGNSKHGSNKPRVQILLEDEKYMVVLEPRDNYVLLITAFYLDRPHSLNKVMRDYERAKAEGAA